MCEVKVCGKNTECHPSHTDTKDQMVCACTYLLDKSVTSSLASSSSASASLLFNTGTSSSSLVSDVMMDSLLPSRVRCERACILPYCNWLYRDALASRLV